MVKNYDFYLQFHEGKLYHAYKYMGCHCAKWSPAAIFRVFAPSALAVSVVGDFNNWDTNASPLKKVTDKGLWEGELFGISKGDSYKYFIQTATKGFYKSDPYAFYSETRELTNSKVYDIGGFTWGDSEYLRRRESMDMLKRPINIYEAHIGSWKRKENGDFYTYRQFADEICVYLKKMHYTHLELMGVAEYPLDDSWGYQVTGYFAPSSRYGSPIDFVYLVNKLHCNGIGLIIDWVPGHFPKNENGLYEFDGQALYEPSGTFCSEHKEWGTRCFDYARPEVRSFLISNAMMWLNIYHADGLRVDAVSGILYLDYGRNHGEWQPNKLGGKENLDAVEFFKELHTVVFSEYKNVLMIAEESTAWPSVTKSAKGDGLGFSFKWNMGWMNDNLSFVQTDPIYRKDIHHKMTFSMTYAFSENYILPISHDEVVYGKRSLLNKMPGDYDLKFAGFRNFLMWMYSHPGKKLLFMGTEFASFDEWDFSKSLFWDFLKYPKHEEAFRFVRTLNYIYMKNNCLWEIDNGWDGFNWIIANDEKRNIFVFERIANIADKMVCIFNFSAVDISNYTFPLSKGVYTSILHTTVQGFDISKEIFKTELRQEDDKYFLTIDIKSMSARYLHKKM